MVQGIIQEDRVLSEVKGAISKALGVDEADIQPQKVLTRDLNAESLDFLDISYNLEQTFGIRMARHFVLDHAEEVFGEGSCIDMQGRLTDKAVALLTLRFGGSRSGLRSGMDMEEVVDLITVDSMARAVMDILDTLPEKCTECPSSEWKCEDGTHVVCSSCGKHALYKGGDDLIVEWLNRVQSEKGIF